MPHTFFISALLTSFFLPVVAFGALVTCGTSTTAPCTICDFYQLVKTLTDFLLIIIVPLAILALAVGGIYLLAAGGRESWVSRGKEIIWSAVIGVLIALVAWIAVNTIMSLLIDPVTFPLPWNQFPSCSTAPGSSSGSAGGFRGGGASGSF